MSLITSRLKQYAELKGLKVTNIEKEAGFPNSTLSRPFKEGKSIRTDTLEKVLKLKSYENIHPFWLITGKGKKEISRDKFNEYAIQQDMEKERLLDTLSNFINFPIEQQSEIKKVIGYYLGKIISEVQEIRNRENNISDVESYKNNLKKIQALAESRQENKVLKKQNEELQQALNKLKSKL